MSSDRETHRPRAPSRCGTSGASEPPPRVVLTAPQPSVIARSSSTPPPAAERPTQADVVTVSRPVGGILSGASRRRGGHPSERPTRGCPCRHGRTGRPSLCSALLRVGFAQPHGSPRTLVRSYRTVSTLPVRRSPGAIGGLLSVALFRQVAPTWLSPAPCPVESRPSSTRSRRVSPARRAAATRPAHRRREATRASDRCRRTSSGSASRC